MLSCREVTTRIASGAGQPLADRLRVRLHLLVCRHCRRYARELRAMGRAARLLFGDPPPVERLAQLEETVLAQGLGRRQGGRLRPGD